MFTGPCLPELDLTLPVGGRLVFVSDLHLRADRRPGDFQASRELIELLGSLREHPGPALLVLGGDIVDLATADGGTPPAELAAGALARPEAQAVAAALRELAARSGATVVYLVGNHDAAVAWDGEARGLVGAAFGVHQMAVRLRVAVQVAGGRELRVVAEHGHGLSSGTPAGADPFDPVASAVVEAPADVLIAEVVKRLGAAGERYPDLALGQIDSVRPAAMMPWWIVSNFFYRFVERALRRSALPALGILAVLLVPALVLGLYLSDSLRDLLDFSGRALRWGTAFLALELPLVALLTTFLGRSLERAGDAYGVPSPHKARAKQAVRQARAPSVLTRLDPDAHVLLVGHSHQPILATDPDGRVVVDAGCWVRNLIAVRAWLGLPPVFAPDYTCSWAELAPTPTSTQVTLWQRRLAIPTHPTLLQRLVAHHPLPPRTATPPTVVACASASLALPVEQLTPDEVA